MSGSRSDIQDKAASAAEMIISDPQTLLLSICHEKYVNSKGLSPDFSRSYVGLMDRSRINYKSLPVPIGNDIFKTSLRFDILIKIFGTNNLKSKRIANVSRLVSNVSNQIYRLPISWLTFLEALEVHLVNHQRHAT